MARPAGASGQPAVSGAAEGLLPRIGLGSAPLGGLFEPVDHDAGVAAVRAAVGAGYRYIDTAPLYGYGAAEQIIGDALSGSDVRSGSDVLAGSDALAGSGALGGSNGVVLSTKVGRTLRPGVSREPDDMFKGSAKVSARFDFSRDAVRESMLASLARLDRQNIELALIHDPDDHVDQAISEAYPALEELRAEGVVSLIGVGTNRSDVPIRFLRETDVDVVLVAGRYTLLDRSAEEALLPEAASRGVEVVAAGVYNSGVLAPTDLPATYDYRPPARSIVDRVERLRQACGRHRVPLAAAAVQFPLRHPAVATVLVGARSAHEAVANLEFSRTSVPDELWEEIDDLHAGSLDA